MQFYGQNEFCGLARGFCRVKFWMKFTFVAGENFGRSSLQSSEACLGLAEQRRKKSERKKTKISLPSSYLANF